MHFMGVDVLPHQKTKKKVDNYNCVPKSVLKRGYFRKTKSTAL